MKTTVIYMSIVLVCLFLLKPVMAEETASDKWRFGTELDVLPYILDGYYLSGIAGYGKWRARYVHANLTTPGFATQSGFDDNEIDIDAYIIDYYFNEGFKGWWVGAGYENWDGSVTEKSSSTRKSYSTDILTLGGGYTYRFSEHFYINPWAALHTPIGGDKEIQFTNETFKIRTTAEVSLKFGVDF